MDEPYRLKDSTRKWVTPLIWVASVILLGSAAIALLKPFVDFIRVILEAFG